MGDDEEEKEERRWVKLWRDEEDDEDDEEDEELTSLEYKEAQFQFLRNMVAAAAVVMMAANMGGSWEPGDVDQSRRIYNSIFNLLTDTLE